MFAAAAELLFSCDALVLCEACVALMMFELVTLLVRPNATFGAEGASELVLIRVPW